MTNLHPSIKYIGVDDTDIALFENQYPVPCGISYNSYLMRAGGATVLFDTVDAHFADQWWQRLTDTLSGETPDYLVCLHMEPDHSACLARAMETFPDMKLICSAAAARMLPQFFDNAPAPGRIRTVKDGEVIDLPDRSLQFITAPMVHWPEVIMAFDSLSGTLFSADAFGTFGALGSGSQSWPGEARRYYCNIVGKYGPQVQALLKKAASLPIAAIAPLHGPALTGNLADYISLYQHWSTYTPEQHGVLVAYASVYGGTREAALRAAAMIADGGVEVAAIDLCHEDVSEAVAQAFRLDTMLLAAPTYDASLFPPMHRFLHHIHLKGLRGRRVGLIENGSWAPVAAKAMRDMLAEMPDMTVVEPAVTIRSRMHAPDLDAISALARALA